MRMPVPGPTESHFTVNGEWQVKWKPRSNVRPCQMLLILKEVLSSPLVREQEGGKASRIGHSVSSKREGRATASLELDVVSRMVKNHVYLGPPLPNRLLVTFIQSS